MSLKVFSMKNNNFKNPVSALFKQLMISIYGFLDSFLRPTIKKKIFEKKLLQFNEKMKDKIPDLDYIEPKAEEDLFINNSNNDDSENKNLRKNISRDYDAIKKKIEPAEEDKEKIKEENIINENQQSAYKDDLANETIPEGFDKGESLQQREEKVDEASSELKEEAKEKFEENENENVHIEKEIKEVNENQENEIKINTEVSKENSLLPTKALDPMALLEKKYSDSESLAKIEAIKIKAEEIDLSEFTAFEIYQTSLAVFKSLISIAEGKKKDWITSSVYSKCLGLELIAGVICQCGFVLKYIPEFVNLIKNDLYKIIKKFFESTNDYAIGFKLSRLTIQIVLNLNICYDLISFILKYAENQLVPWQKLIGMECIASILGNSYLLRDLYEKKFDKVTKGNADIYDEVISSLTKISYACVTSKPADSKKAAQEKKAAGTETYSTLKISKNIENSSILTESDVQIPNYTQHQLLKLISECYHNIRDSYVIILETANLKLGMVNRDFDNEQLLSKDMTYYNYEAIKNSMTALILNSSDESATQNYLMLFQSYINIFGSIALPIARDSYLNDLCKLAIPNNLENSLELSSKNILITKTLFNIAHCVNILDSNSWLLLIETMQKIYLMLINSNNHLLKPSEEFDIDVVIKNLEANIRKFNPSYKLVEEKNTIQNDSAAQECLKEESKENNLNSTQNASAIGADGTTNASAGSSAVAEKKKSSSGGGIFSSLKNAFGLGKSKQIDQTGNINNIKRPAEENIDIQILSGAIDTLFINSTLYEEETLKDITKAFLESSKTILTNNPITNDISNIYLNFNLTKLLELSVINVSRIPLFWEAIIDLISFITQKNSNNISRFALDCLTIINMFLLGEYNSGKIDFFLRSSINRKFIEKLWEEDSWQNTIFTPFKSIAQQNISQSININIIYNLSKILQNCGHYLNYQGWNNYIFICDILVSKSDEIICENVFKLVEQIINEYSEYLTLSNVNCLINNLEIFAQYKKNTNISFIAITMFWNISGIIEKYIKLINLPQDELWENKDYLNFSEYQRDFFKKYSTPEERVIYTNQVWHDFFSKIVGICSDNLFDVRKSAINIFADIFVAKNILIENSTAIEIINKYFLEILDKSYSIFEEKMKSNRAKKNVSSDAGPAQQLAAPKFSDVTDIKFGDFKVDQLKLPEKKAKFDEEEIQKLSQPSQEETEWEDTTILLTQALGKVLKSFLTRNLNFVKDFNFYNESLINSLIKKYCKIMRMATPRLAGATLGSIQEIYNSNVELFMSQFENLWIIYDEMGKFITTDFYLNNLCTMASSSKMISNVLEILKEIFLKESNLILKPDLLQDRNLSNLLEFTHMLIKSSRNSEGMQAINNPQRILFDEKMIFDFIEKIAKLLNNSNSWRVYLEYLCSYVDVDLTDHHSEAHCRKALEMFETFFSTITAKLYNIEEKNLLLESFEEANKLSSKSQEVKLKSVEEAYLHTKSYLILDFINEHFPKLLECIKDLCSLRNKNEFVSVIIKNNKSQLQIWHYASFQLIKIISLILCKSGSLKKKEEENSVNDNTNNSSIIPSFQNKPANAALSFCNYEDPENKEYNNQMNEIWESSIRCFETIFRQSEAGYKNISRNLLEDLLKSCQEMEIQIINFIVNSLLPNSLKIPKEMQIKLLMLLDIGSNFDYNILNTITQSASISSSISRVCIENLFELCKFRSEESLKKGIYRLT